MSDEEQLDLIVIGAGPAGIACAHEAVKRGLDVAVLERGDVAGAKNLSGGRLYLEPLRELCGDLLEGAPFERRVTRETIALTDDHSSLSIAYAGPESDMPESVTVLRAKLDEFLADRVTEAGAMVMGQQKVDELVREGDRVVGVKVGSEELRARVVVAADGALSFLAEETGLRQKRSTADLAVGVKELVKLDSATIDDRFNVAEGCGEARLFVGGITDGLAGGGFLYTNKDTLSIGLVVQMDALQGWKSDDKLWELLERFKQRADVAPLIAGGETVEYGAHLIPEGGYDALPRSFGVPGLMLAGDAAGLVLNTGTTVRGMDLAFASGVLAGRAVADAAEGGGDAASCLASYERSLRSSFVIEELERARKLEPLLAQERIYEHYPKEAVRLVRKLFTVGADARGMTIGEAMREMRKSLFGWQGLKDLWRFYRS